MNLASQLIEKRETMPQKVCLIEKKRQLTYKELYQKVANFSQHLKENEITHGTKVLVLVPMSIDLYITLLSLWSVGAVACFMDAGFIKQGMKNNEFDEVDGMIGITKYMIYADINPHLRMLKKRVNVQMIEKLKNVPSLEIESVSGDTSAILTYTSGTTGKSKIVSRTHDFLQIQSEILEESLNYEQDDVELSSIPIFTLCNISAGITTVIADGNYTDLGASNPKTLFNQIKNHHINRLMAAPGMLNVITQYCLNHKTILPQIHKVFTGGGAVFLDFVENMKKVYPASKIITLYGSTEAEPIAELDISDMTSGDIEDTKKGKGILAGNVVGVSDCKTIITGIDEIGDITQKEFEGIKTDGVGEIVVAGKNVLQGYVNGIGDKENKFSVDSIKYHRTGDLGWIDGQGRIWLRGRIKEPYFDIEASLHAQLKIGKTAIFKHHDKIILVLEKGDKIKEDKVREVVPFAKIDEIRYVKKIPVDKRHSTKVDYKELKKILKITE